MTTTAFLAALAAALSPSLPQTLPQEGPLQAGNRDSGTVLPAPLTADRLSALGAELPLDEPGVQTATCGVDTTIPAAQLGSCPDAQATLNAHNAERAR